MQYVPTTHKFVAVLNKKAPSGRVLNALAHATAGLAASFEDKAAFRLQTYVDKDGGQHPNISDNPFIVLQADNSNQIRTLREKLVAGGVAFSDFTNTMVEGTYAEQHDRTNQTLEAELEYIAIVFFGEAETLAPLTKKFSLWRG